MVIYVNLGEIRARSKNSPQKFGSFEEISYLCRKLELIKCCNMNIRVIIDKLGPIQNSEIEFKPFLVYTGESGLGKS